LANAVWAARSAGAIAAALASSARRVMSAAAVALWAAPPPVAPAAAAATERTGLPLPAPAPDELLGTFVLDAGDEPPRHAPRPTGPKPGPPLGNDAAMMSGGQLRFRIAGRRLWGGAAIKETGNGKTDKKITLNPIKP